MPRVTATFRITFGLVCLTVSLVLVAKSLGLIPDRARDILQGRKDLCETIAIDYSAAAERGDLRAIRSGLKAILKRNSQILSAGLRMADGSLAVEVGNHRAHWAAKTSNNSTSTHMLVPISAKNRPWGTLEICFVPPVTRLLGPLAVSDLGLVLFVATGSSLLFYTYLRRVLGHLNPTNVIPQRVRTTLNTVAGGLIVLDENQRMVLANDAFAELVGIPAADLAGRNISELPWIAESSGQQFDEYPWTEAIRKGSLQTGRPIKLDSPQAGLRTLRVNSSPILAEDGKCRGVLASVEDVTLLEERNAKLSDTLKRLSLSRNRIRQQNEELATLATRDPLTHCLNRRAGSEKTEQHLASSREEGRPLGFLMLDIDHFKAVNDNHGHTTGDEVLKIVAHTVTDTVGDAGFVGRYGGEEFCAVLPDADLETAAAIAEQVRAAIEAAECNGLKVTASLGVTCTANNSFDQRVLIEQADQALYTAKRRGRNQVVRWDQTRESEATAPSQRKDQRTRADDPQTLIPFRAVTVLVSALQYRYPPIAEHSHRVADLCTTVAQGLIPERQRYVLEVAALLHDLGKLSVPDSILMKEGPLSDEERKFLRTHEKAGIDILTAAFHSPDLKNIFQCHHAWFDGNTHDESVPAGEEIPLGARILFIAEAYDAMVSDQVYRKGMSPEEAFAELRRNSGTQFDPQLVERFIDVVSHANRASGARPNLSPQQVALRLGLQTEKLGRALEAEDTRSLADVADRLERTANQCELRELADAAVSLKQQIAADFKWAEVLDVATALIETCDATQSSVLQQAV